MATLEGSVGAGGENREADVRTVQMLLNRWSHVVLYGKLSLLEGGKSNDDTIDAIRNFERGVLRLPSSGIVHRGSRVWDALHAAEAWTSPSWRPQQTITGRGEAWVRANYGGFTWTPKPATTPKQAITIQGNWVRDNIESVAVPQVKGIETYGNSRMGGTIRFHRLAATRLQALWAEWEQVGLIPLINFWGGSFVPRYQTGSIQDLSNHSWGTAFDINPATNGYKVTPPGLGQPGCLLPLVPIAERHGFAWGGFFSKADGMHFEIAVEPK